MSANSNAQPPSGERADRTAVPLLGLTLVMLASGAVLRVTSGSHAAAVVWMVGLVATGCPVVWRSLRRMIAGKLATDLVAMLAIATAVALAQPLAGLVIVLMQTGGEALERFAEGRASAAVRALEAEAPRIAHRLLHGEAEGLTAATEEIGVAFIVVGDRLLVRPGEMVPCDAVVVDGSSHLDTSRLTGEPMPTKVEQGAQLSSGSLNLDGPLVLRASATAGESQYARIVQLVRSAQSSKAPLQRVADRYAMWFTPLTLAACAVAYLASGDLDRVLAVLVVATPCPLIIATPIAIIGGVNRAARRSIVVRHGGALEQLASITTAVFDKTGTLTVGTPAVSDVRAAAGFTSAEVLALAASVERGSGHLLARSVVKAADEGGVELLTATDVRESPGRGVIGRVGERVVYVGARSFVDEHLGPTPVVASSAVPEAGLRAHVAVDGRYAGCIEFADQVRPRLPELFAALRRVGIRRCMLLSGDSVAHTEAVAAMVGLSEARGELLPADKVRVVADLIAQGERVLMVGDGTNDAPALSTATVGVALAGHGGGITAEAADVVILNDDLGRVPEAIEISRRTLRIARQSIWTGLGLSALAMLVAAGGYIAPAVGALLQEAIDVAVILNALRSSAPPRFGRTSRAGDGSSRLRRSNQGIGATPMEVGAG